MANGIQRLQQPEGLRACEQCLRRKPPSAFSQDKRFKKPTLRKFCDSCLAKNRATASRNYHKRNRPRQTAYMREWRKTNGNQGLYEWRKNNPEKVRAIARRWRERNPARAKELSQKYKAKFQATHPNYHKEYYRKNKETKMAYQREYRLRKKEQAHPAVA